MQAKVAEQRGLWAVAPQKYLIQVILSIGPAWLRHLAALIAKPNLHYLSGGICWLYVGIQLPTPQVV